MAAPIKVYGKIICLKEGVEFNLQMDRVMKEIGKKINLMDKAPMCLTMAQFILVNGKMMFRKAQALKLGTMENGM